MADSSLSAIRTKVRRLTRSPSEAQLTTSQLDEYINTFVIYDFPEHLRTYNLRTTFTFYTNPFQDVYFTDILGYGGASQASTNPLYDFQNRYLTVHTPVYIAGFQSFYSQSREQFFGIYPFVNSISSIGPAGDGVTTTFSGVINTQQSIVLPGQTQQQIGLLQRQVLFSSVDSNNNGLSLIDVPVLDSVTGNPTVFGNLYVPGTEPATPPLAVAPYPLVPGGAPNANNYINYSTGAFTITFPSAPGSGRTINSQTVPNALARPQALLFYDNKFTIRPVPDQAYRVNFEAYVRPTELLSSGQNPQLNEWWQYISYGAAKKIFEDKMDTESVQQIMPEFKAQQSLVLRRTIVQNTNERTATIYTEQTGFGPGWGQGGWGYGSGTF